MSHPYHHAVSSAQLNGGHADDYLAVHSFFDRSKAQLAHWSHRSLYHHEFGVSDAVNHFGETVGNSDGVQVSVKQLGQQHVDEDFNLRRVTARDWLAALRIPANHRFWARARTTAESHAAFSAQRFGGHTADYLAVHETLDRHNLGDGPESGLFSHHAAGIFDVEMFLGPTVTNSLGKRIPTRFLCELHITAEYGFIPTAHDWCRLLVREIWMNETQSKTRSYAASINPKI